MFELKSEITIGGFRFSGVHEVRIAKAMHDLVETAKIKLPSVARVIKNGKVQPGNIVTGKQFKDGDPVTIKLGYSVGNQGIGQNSNGLHEEFNGFVRLRNMDMPLEVVCEGYSWQLRRYSITNFWSSVSVKDYLMTAVSGCDGNYPITIECDLDMELNNVDVNNQTGLEMIQELGKMTDNAVTCFFVRPGVLWCGLPYTNYVQGKDILGDGHETKLKYRPGYNALQGSQLKDRFLIDNPVVVRYTRKMANGSVVSGTSGNSSGAVKVRNKVLGHVMDASWLTTLAVEKSWQLNYSGYEGYLTGFLQPFANPGKSVYITDSRYPEKNGVYLVEGTEVVFGVNGARRFVEVGMKLG